MPEEGTFSRTLYDMLVGGSNEGEIFAAFPARNRSTLSTLLHAIKRPEKRNGYARLHNGPKRRKWRMPVIKDITPPPPPRVRLNDKFPYPDMRGKLGTVVGRYTSRHMDTWIVRFDDSPEHTVRYARSYFDVIPESGAA